jgi:hypothetical protein
MLIRPSCRSESRLRAPSARLIPPVSNARLSAAGFVRKVVDGRHRVDELSEVELEAPLLRGVLPVGLLGLLQQELGGEQVRLLERLVEGVLLPVGRREPLVRAAFLLVSLPGLEAPEADRRLPPGVHGGAEELRVEVRRPLHGARGVAHLAHPEGLEGARDLDPVEGQHVLHRVGVPHLLDRREQRIVPDRPLGQALYLVTGRDTWRHEPGTLAPGVAVIAPMFACIHSVHRSNGAMVACPVPGVPDRPAPLSLIGSSSSNLLPEWATALPACPG